MSVRRWLSVFLTFSTLAISILLPVRPVAAEPRSPLFGSRAPLVVITPEGSASSFLERLRAAGYADGRDLFALATEDGDYVLQSAAVRRVFSQALEAGGGRRVDAVAVGSLCLAARLAILLEGEPGPVRTLVMVAPPNRGSFAATALRLTAQLEKQADFRQLIGRLPEGERPTKADFADEAEYVATRALRVYEPLAMRYYREVKFGANGDPTTTFISWLAREEKGLFDTSVAGAQVPPNLDRYPALASLVDPPPGTEEALTRAFIEFEAIRAAEYNWARLAQHKKPLPTAAELLEGVLAAKAGGLKRAVLDLLAKTLRSLGFNVLIGEAGRLGTAAATRLLGFDPWASSAARLTTVDLPLPSASPSDPEAVILANYFLDHWGGQETCRRLVAEGSPSFATAVGPPNPRFVTIAGKWPNLWSVFPALSGGVRSQANDLRTELLAMSLPVRENDAFTLLRGAPSFNPTDLLERRDVQDLIFRELGGVKPVRVLEPTDGRRLGPRQWAAEGQVTVVANAPSYVEFHGDRIDRPGRLLVELSPPNRLEPGYDLSAWAYAEMADGSTARRELAVEGSRGPLAADFAAFGGDCVRVWVGLRFRPSSGLAEVLSPGVEAKAALRFRATFIPDDLNEGSEPAPPSEPVPAGPGESGGSEPPAGQPAPTPPTIAVIRRSKKTTHREERRTFHQRWEWDFGDGTTTADPDPAHIETVQSHRFAPGQYTVTATSTDNGGQIIRQLTWPVEGDGGEREFRAETIREPAVKVVIDGPKMWVTGKPAEFKVTARVDDPPLSVNKVVTIDPGPVFYVVWARPGTFEVSAAVTVRLSYRFPERSVFVVDTYVETVAVEVCTTATTQ
ncbi:MAG TPA: PKD domain-containing protein [Bacillota bacterium]